VAPRDIVREVVCEVGRESAMGMICGTGVGFASGVNKRAWVGVVGVESGESREELEDVTGTESRSVIVGLRRTHLPLQSPTSDFIFPPTRVICHSVLYDSFIHPVARRIKPPAHGGRVRCRSCKNG